MREISFFARPEDEGKRVESVLTGPMEISHGLLSRLKRREQGICVNGQRVYSTYVLRAGDRITAQVGDTQPPRMLAPLPMPLSIVYEDEDLLIVDKAKGMPIHPTKDPMEANLEQGLLAYLPEGAYPHFVSRLDKGTTGLMMVAKSGYAHELMKRRQHTEGFFREYLAVAEGEVPEERGTIDAPIGLAEGSRYRHTVRPDGAASLTQFERVQVKHGRTLLRLVPQTGRTHQLRVHMAYRGFPLIGDWLYGHPSEDIDRPALHSWRLRFIHPLTNELIKRTSPLPEDMENLLK